MATPYLGEIRMFGGNFAPVNWHLCDGTLLAINGNEALFSLLGTTYGGDGITTFGLPDLRGRVPIHQGTNQGGTYYPNGTVAGTETVSLLWSNLPQHTHSAAGTTTASTSSPDNQVWAENSGVSAYSTSTTPSQTMNNQALTLAGGSLPHDNMMPFTAITYIIALLGVYPTQS